MSTFPRQSRKKNTLWQLTTSSLGFWGFLGFRWHRRAAEVTISKLCAVYSSHVAWFLWFWSAVSTESLPAVNESCKHAHLLLCIYESEWTRSKYTYMFFCVIHLIFIGLHFWVKLRDRLCHICTTLGTPIKSSVSLSSSRQSWRRICLLVLDKFLCLLNSAALWFLFLDVFFFLLHFNDNISLCSVFSRWLFVPLCPPEL